MILTITGAAGAGKSTLAKSLVRLARSAELSPGCTTRPVRPSETSADVCHLTQDAFREMHERGEFLWTVEVHGHQYGTLRRVIEDGLAASANWLLFALTPDVVQILKDFASASGGGERVRSIYVLSPGASDLRERLLARGEASDVIERRLTDCKEWDATARASGLYDLLVPGQGNVEENARRVINSLGM